MGAHLRPAASQDAPGVADVLLASRKEFLAYAPLAHSDAQVRQWVRGSLIPSGGVTVACLGSQIVGVLAAACEADVSWIHQLYLLPAHVGRGFGSQLLARALNELPRPVRLYTFQANKGARRFYERNGFVPVEFGDGSTNEERCPDVLYELAVA
jgi:GNAT superfamily N-acetyltransferase